MGSTLVPDDRSDRSDGEFCEHGSDISGRRAEEREHDDVDRPLAVPYCFVLRERGGGDALQRGMIQKTYSGPGLGWLNSFRLLEPIGYITAREAEKAFYANICTCNLIACAALTSLR